MQVISHADSSRYHNGDNGLLKHPSESTFPPFVLRDGSPLSPASLRGHWCGYLRSSFGEGAITDDLAEELPTQYFAGIVCVAN